MSNRFHETLRIKMDDFVYLVYKSSKGFPREELYGATSQIRRASLSVVLNYIEGYARMRQKPLRHFLEISYGSLQEAKYLLSFMFREGWMGEDDFRKTHNLANEIGAMIWSILKKIR